MSVKELNEIGRKDIPYGIRLKNAIKIRDFKDALKEIKKEFSLEVFNNHDVFKEGEFLGVTLYHPDMEHPTHISTAIYPISVGEKEFERLIKKAEKDLEKKIEGN